MARRPLRAVTADEAPKQPAKSVSDAAENGTERELLVAMRSVVAKAVDNPDTAARDLASLTKRLNDIAREIKAIDARESEEGTASGPVPDEAFDASAI
jgi:hypothetical protein